jgi:hypothetical protein
MSRGETADTEDVDTPFLVRLWVQEAFDIVLLGLWCGIKHRDTKTLSRFRLRLARNNLRPACLNYGVVVWSLELTRCFHGVEMKTMDNIIGA